MYILAYQLLELCEPYRLTVVDQPLPGSTPLGYTNV